jgi:hypothetical protein
VVFGLVTGQRAHGRQLAALHDFDTWTTTLTSAPHAEIVALDHD